MSVNRPASYILVAGAMLCIIVNLGIARTQELQDPTDQHAVLRIVRHGAQLSISGNISSAAHESILRQIAGALFSDDDHDFALKNDVVTPPGWALLTELTLRAMSETYSASATISTWQIDVRGITTDPGGWKLAANRLDANLLPGMKFVADMAQIQPATSIRTQCTTLFRSIWRRQSIAFSHGSARIRTSGFEILDELIQLGADCPDAKIIVTGHTDNTGTEAGNKQLSQARADSVVTYMVDRGIAADRLSSTGAGSTEPLLDKNHSRARKLNRRIEIEFSYP